MFCLSLHYSESNRLLYVNGVYQFKPKGSDIKTYSLCLRNISKEFKVNSMKKTGLKGYAYDFSFFFFLAISQVYLKAKILEANRN